MWEDEYPSTKLRNSSADATPLTPRSTFSAVMPATASLYRPVTRHSHGRVGWCLFSFSMALLPPSIPRLSRGLWLISFFLPGRDRRIWPPPHPRSAGCGPHSPLSTSCTWCGHSPSADGCHPAGHWRGSRRRTGSDAHRRRTQGWPPAGL